MYDIAYNNVMYKLICCLVTSAFYHFCGFFCATRFTLPLTLLYVIINDSMAISYFQFDWFHLRSVELTLDIVAKHYSLHRHKHLSRHVLEKGDKPPLMSLL